MISTFNVKSVPHNRYLVHFTLERLVCTTGRASQRSGRAGKDGGTVLCLADFLVQPLQAERQGGRREGWVFPHTHVLWTSLPPCVLESQAVWSVFHTIPCSFTFPTSVQQGQRRSWQDWVSKTKGASASMTPPAGVLHRQTLRPKARFCPGHLLPCVDWSDMEVFHHGIRMFPDAWSLRTDAALGSADASSHCVFLMHLQSM